ncbi:glycine zipper 2TM domain-containing protein [Celerinatantimonas sp. MCCC 1A17872]|uniref:glycine zipper 2TM domain-containing protein n=1 Tax=Celerinatantimonas sp. MCCC 1A17872 TaxID=3177514 RepID=UPI0038C04B1D
MNIRFRSWVLFSVVLLTTTPVWANYHRNVARPVEQVVFGEVTSVRYFNPTQARHVQHNPWKTLLGGVVGGVLGNQFGKGWGRVVATGVGAAAGGAIAQQAQGPEDQSVQYHLVELLIRDNDTQKLIDVVQDYDPSMQFHKGQSVRILYFKEGVRVDTDY